MGMMSPEGSDWDRRVGLVHKNALERRGEGQRGVEGEIRW